MIARTGSARGCARRAAGRLFSTVIANAKLHGLLIKNVETNDAFLVSHDEALVYVHAALERRARERAAAGA